MTTTQLVSDTPPDRGGNSPWGTIDNVHELAPGIVSVDTSGHGGIWINSQRLNVMLKEHAALCRPTRFYPLGQRASAYQWFEEDCEWARVALAFPEAFPPASIEHARLTLQAMHKDILRDWDLSRIANGRPLVGIGGAS